jgi:hypothetical protein
LVPVASILTGAVLRFTDGQVKDLSRRLARGLRIRSLRRQVDATSVSNVEKRAMRRKIDAIELDLIDEELRALKSGRAHEPSPSGGAAHDGEP